MTAQTFPRQPAARDLPGELERLAIAGTVEPVEGLHYFPGDTERRNPVNRWRVTLTRTGYPSAVLDYYTGLGITDEPVPADALAAVVRDVDYIEDEGDDGVTYRMGKAIEANAAKLAALVPDDWERRRIEDAAREWDR
jgi:hypothetical protein